MAKLIRDEIITEKHQLANQMQMFVLGGSHNPANLISLSIGLLLENKE
jgi:cytochrome P450